MFGPYSDILFFHTTVPVVGGLSRLALCCETSHCGFDDAATQALDITTVFRGVIRLQNLSQVSETGRILLQRQAARDGLALEFSTGGDRFKLREPIDVTIQGEYAHKYTFTLPKPGTKKPPGSAFTIMAFADQTKTLRRTYKVLSLSKVTYLLSRRAIESTLIFNLFSDLKEKKLQDSASQVPWFVDQHHAYYRQMKPSIRTIHRRDIYHVLACHWDTPGFQEDLVKHRILTRDECQWFHDQVRRAKLRETGSKWGDMRISSQADVNNRLRVQTNSGVSNRPAQTKPKRSWVDAELPPNSSKQARIKTSTIRRVLSPDEPENPALPTQLVRWLPTLPRSGRWCCDVCGILISLRSLELEDFQRLSNDERLVLTGDEWNWQDVLPRSAFEKLVRFHLARHLAEKEV